MLISDKLKESNIQLNDGDYLVSVTRSEGYVPTYKMTDNVHKGQYLFKVVGVGTADGTTGLFPEYHVVPVNVTADGADWEDDLENPIAVQVANQVTYLTGRNHPMAKDAYHGREFHVRDGIADGEEHRHLLLAFNEFVNSEYSMGVNEFQLAGPEFLDQTP